MPRKRKVTLTPEMLKMVEQLAFIRLPQDDIAIALGMAPATFEERLKTDDDLQHAIKTGKSRSRVKVFKTLYDSAFGREPVRDDHGNIIREGRDPDPRLMMYWCDTQERFVKSSKLELTGQDGGPIKVQSVPMTEAEILAELERIDQVLIGN